MTASRSVWRKALPIIALGIAIFVIAGFIYDLGGPSGNRLEYLALLASFGGIFGSSLALDGESDLSVGNHPLLRIAASAGFGASATCVVWSWVQAPSLSVWLTLGVAFGAALGWFGWGWAKHVNF